VIVELLLEGEARVLRAGIREIDRWVVRQAMELAAAGGHPLELNLSAESLGDASLLAYVEQELTRTGADPSALVFELTETGLLRDDAPAQSFIEGIARLGSHVALDDFGTGYGGFTYVSDCRSTSSRSTSSSCASCRTTRRARTSSARS